MMSSPARPIRSLVAIVGLCLATLPGMAHAARVASYDAPAARASYQVELVSVSDVGECSIAVDFSQVVRVCEVQTEVGRRSVRCSTLELGEAGSSVSFSLLANDQSFFEVSTDSSYRAGDVFRGDSASSLFSAASDALSAGKSTTFTQVIDAGNGCQRAYGFSVTAR
jgi:hypothetical protein